ncbi:unnamed protein product [[Actinomadura] parvosata subsp. kistnae]|nr:unnamed protein product [Actinomadura parvosata subsp. kistnae]
MALQAAWGESTTLAARRGPFFVPGHEKAGRASAGGRRSGAGAAR